MQPGQSRRSLARVAPASSGRMIASHERDIVEAEVEAVLQDANDERVRRHSAGVSPHAMPRMAVRGCKAVKAVLTRAGSLFPSLFSHGKHSTQPCVSSQ